MADPFVAEIRIFPFNFPPTGWAFCDGQLMALSQNTALFSLLGTMYGGDGKSTFGLPNLQGSAPMFWGQGQGLTDRFEGEAAGEEFVTLIDSEMPFHQHQLEAGQDPGDNQMPDPTRVIGQSQPFIYKKPAGAAPVQPLAFQAVAPQGGSLPHNNMQPYLTLNFCIALQGVFPPRG